MSHWQLYSARLRMPPNWCPGLSNWHPNHQNCSNARAGWRHFFVIKSIGRKKTRIGTQLNPKRTRNGPEQKSQSAPKTPQGPPEASPRRHFLRDKKHWARKIRIGPQKVCGTSPKRTQKLVHSWCSSSFGLQNDAKASECDSHQC